MLLRLLMAVLLSMRDACSFVFLTILVAWHLKCLGKVYFLRCFHHGVSNSFFWSRLWNGRTTLFLLLHWLSWRFFTVMICGLAMIRLIVLAAGCLSLVVANFSFYMPCGHFLHEDIARVFRCWPCMWSLRGHKLLGRLAMTTRGENCRVTRIFLEVLAFGASCDLRFCGNSLLIARLWSGGCGGSTVGSNRWSLVLHFIRREWCRV